MTLAECVYKIQHNQVKSDEFTLVNYIVMSSIHDGCVLINLESFLNKVENVDSEEFKKLYKLLLEEVNKNGC